MTHFADADGARGVAVAARRRSTPPRGPAGERNAEQQRGDRCAIIAHDVGHARRLGAPGIMYYGSAPGLPRNTTSPLGPAAGDDAALSGSSPRSPCARRHGRLRRQPSLPRADTASASSPAATPTAIPATRPPAPRCSWTACGRLVGRVSMDMLTVDQPDAGARRRRGHQVTLWAGDGGTTMLAIIDDIAQHASGTIGYERCARSPARAGERRVPVGPDRSNQRGPTRTRACRRYVRKRQKAARRLGACRCWVPTWSSAASPRDDDQALQACCTASRRRRSPRRCRRRHCVDELEPGSALPDRPRRRWPALCAPALGESAVAGSARTRCLGPPDRRWSARWCSPGWMFLRLDASAAARRVQADPPQACAPDHRHRRS